MTEPIWRPSPKRINNCNMSRYIDWLRDEHGLSVESWDSLYKWSVTEIDAFWKSIWQYAAIIHSQPPDRIRTGEHIWETAWFEGARLNFAENLLKYSDDRPAIISHAEGKEPVSLTFKDLRSKVAACASGLRNMGVKKGDRVAAMLPNIAETVIAMLATTSIGAVWSSCSPDFGEGGILDRFQQIRPRVLVTSNAYQYNGRRYDSLSRARNVGKELSDLAGIVVINHLPTEDQTLHDNEIAWSDLLADASAQLVFEQLPFDHPVYIMYSSGTTGKPKCLVHGAGGTLLQHAKEHLLHTDLTRDDTITYFTTCGWMMWNWLVSALQVGACVFLYEGSPTYPNLSVLWSAIEENGVTVFGTSPKYLSLCENRGLRPGEDRDLSRLRTILSTGAPLSPQNFDYVYTHINSDVLLASISGGTDIISCFMLGNPLLPVYPGEIQGRGLGMKVEVYNEEGEPVVGEVGELVCSAPFPSRPVYFWDDPESKKYKAAYFDTYPDVWRHGDYVMLNQRGGIVVYGRSDATLNPGGVRIGTAEIYGPVESVDEVADSLVIGQQWENDVRVVLFVKTESGVELDDALRQRIKNAIRAQRTPRHVPAIVLQVPEIPYTLNGKKVELAVTRIVHGHEVTNQDALANPEALKHFRNLPELTEA